MDEELKESLKEILKYHKCEVAYHRAWPKRMERKHKDKAMGVLIRFWEEDKNSEPTMADLVSLAKMVSYRS